MAATGFTPISLYYSTTTSQTPVAGNLVNGELAINITDGKLFYKDNAGVVQTIASKGAASPVTTFSAGSTGLTPSTATSGAVTLDGTLAIGSGGTGQTTKAAAFNALSPVTTTGDLIIGDGTNSSTRLGIGANTYILTSNGTTATWAAPGSSGGGFTSTSIISTNTAATAKVLYVMTASLTLTLPASPSVGDYVGVSNLSGTTTCVIGRNGNNIMSSATDMTVDVVSAGFTLYYASATQGWVIL
jgi:hypothetical protein